jgi:membrane protease YdiL (CAAX protease family)
MNVSFPKKNVIKLFLYTSFFVIFLNIIISMIFDKITTFYHLEFKSNSVPFQSKTEEFVLVVFIAPILETLIFQYLPYFYLKKYRDIYTLLISSILFGLAHAYSIIYIIYGFAVGLLFISAYYYSIKKNVNPFLLVAFSHFIYNLFAFCMNNFF